MRRSLLCALVLGVLCLVCAPSSVLAAGDANMASCSNEALAGFQPYLADCRAYEMVTPPFKDGFGVSVLDVSGDGSRLLGESLGAFAGTENDFFNAFYEFSRSGSEWVASAITPPASLFPGFSFATASADLGRTLWGLRRPSQSIYAMDLYVRETDGSFVEVGPMFPPALSTGPPAGRYEPLPNYGKYAGASSDLSHVLFTLNGSSGSASLWPGDTTVPSTRPSLYEYAGAGNRRPQLVGVSDGHTIVNDETLAAGKLISDCGTFLGAEEGLDSHNAVSSNGETVFFTPQGHSNVRCDAATYAPEVSEVYARLGEAETVAISEPSSHDCLACNTAAKSPAEFRGASSDGSKAFFLTEQELLSGDTTMNLYEYDFDSREGEKIVRVSAGSATPRVIGVARVSQDGSHVYFVAEGVLTGENAEHGLPVEGKDNLYVFERDATYPDGRVTFVGTLSTEDAEDWSAYDRRFVQATPDGRHLVFQSRADLTPGDASSQQQVFEYDALTEDLVRVSVAQAGYSGGMASADAHAASITAQEFGAVFSPAEVNNRLAVSADGSLVVFASAGALTPDAEPAAAAGGESVYEYRSTGSISDGNVYLVSDGRDAPGGGQPGALLSGLDASGGDVFFATSDPLLAQDVDGQFDVYDARAGGGFPVAAASAACEGEECQGLPSPRRSFGGPGSASVQGGNVPLASPPGPSVAKPKSKHVTAAQKLAQALKRCRAEHGSRRRAACQVRARRRYAKKANVNAKGKR